MSSSNPKEILEQMLAGLGFSASVTETPTDDGLLLDVKSDDSGRLIGRQGQTLADLQYLVNRIAFRKEDEGRVLVDIGGYRRQAREEIEKMALAAAEKVRRWGDVVELEPMNAYERRLVHQALKDDPQIETHSVEVEGSSRKAILLRPRRQQ